MTPRPKLHDTPILAATAIALAPKVLAWLKLDGDDTTLEDVTKILTKSLSRCISFDGFDLAYRLKRDCEYAPDSALVEILDLAFFHAKQALSGATQQWVIANAIAPKFKAGDLVQFKWKTQQMHGVVDAGDLYAKDGQYAINVPGMNGKPIVNWEDVQAVDA